MTTATRRAMLADIELPESLECLLPSECFARACRQDTLHQHETLRWVAPCSQPPAVVPGASSATADVAGAAALSPMLSAL
jgi:hypothetical protein